VTRSFFLAIEGAIGVGKTTLARLLQPRFDAELLLETFEENPFLSDFYLDRERYAFQTQIFFLLSRYRQQQSIATSLARGPLIADYTIAKDSLFAHLTLDGDELEMYDRLYDVLVARVLIPDLVIYLRADTDVLMMRITSRDRAYERGMDRAYIEALRQAYDRHFSTYTETPVLTIDTNDLDYVRDASALDFVESQVRTALGLGAYQQPLPRVELVRPSPMRQVQRTDRPQMLRRKAMEQFLAVSAAVGRVGAALSNSREEQSGKQRGGLEAAMRDVIVCLQSLALASGVELREEAVFDDHAGAV